VLRRQAVAVLAILVAGCGGGSATTNSVTQPPLGMKRATDARACLTRAGFHVLGGPRPPHNLNAPDVELIVNERPAGPTFLAFYRRVDRARRLEPMIQRRAARIHGASVERHGTVTIFWSTKPAPDTRAQIERCAFAA
jgi:hypothetical protein